MKTKTKLNNKGRAALKSFEAEYADALNGAIELLNLAIVVAENHIYCRSTFGEIIAIFATLPDWEIKQLNSGRRKQKAPSRYEMAKKILASANRIRHHHDNHVPSNP